MDEINTFISEELKSKIYILRGVSIMLDRDLAKIYGVKAIRLREQLKRNLNKFPEDFCFQLNESEIELLVSQFAIPSKKHLGGSMPYAFTEHGVAMLSSILNSEKAIQLNIFIIRAFILMRKNLVYNEEIQVRLNILERKSLLFENKFDKLFTLLENPINNIKQGIFYDGQIFDSYAFISNLIKSANNEIILLDNFVDQNTFLLLNKRKKGVIVTIYTKNFNENLKQDLEKYNSQYEAIKISKFNFSHDRFLIIDKQEIYHFGASLKDLGKKWFAFSKLEKENLNILEKLN